MEQSTSKAAGLYITACLFVVAMTAFGKALSETGLHPIEIAFYRNLGGFIIVTGLILAFRRFDLLKTTRLKAQINRAFIGNIGIIMLFWATSLMPLTNVTAILYTSPIFLTLFSMIVLKEGVGATRIIAVLMGFIGTLFLMHPSGEGYSTLGVGLAVMNAMTIAAVGISLRSLGSSENAITTSFYFFLFGIFFPGVLLPFVWTGLPDISLILIGIIITGLINQPLKTHAFRLAPASVISPIQYFNVVWATIIGYFVWNDVPSMNIIIGCVIVIASNLFLLWRERTKAPL